MDKLKQSQNLAKLNFFVIKINGMASGREDIKIARSYFTMHDLS